MNGQSTEILVLPEQNGAASPGNISSVLRQLRKYIHLARGSDFFHKVLETYATQISLIGIGLATTVTVARALGPEGRGLYAVAMRWAPWECSLAISDFLRRTRTTSRKTALCCRDSWEILCWLALSLAAPERWRPGLCFPSTPNSLLCMDPCLSSGWPGFHLGFAFCSCSVSTLGFTKFALTTKLK